MARRRVDGRDEKVLRLAIVDSKDAKTHTYAYRNLGEIDEQGFMYVFQDIPEDDAWQVYGEADMLQKLRDGEGTIPQLPNLNFNLLSIDNMNTAIRKASDVPRPNPYLS